MHGTWVCYVDERTKARGHLIPMLPADPGEARESRGAAAGPLRTGWGGGRRALPETGAVDNGGGSPRSVQVRAAGRLRQACHPGAASPRGTPFSVCMSPSPGGCSPCPA